MRIIVAGIMHNLDVYTYIIPVDFKQSIDIIHFYTNRLGIHFSDIA